MTSYGRGLDSTALTPLPAQDRMYPFGIIEIAAWCDLTRPLCKVERDSTVTVAGTAAVKTGFPQSKLVVYIRLYLQGNTGQEEDKAQHAPAESVESALLRILAKSRIHGRTAPRV